MPLYTGDKIGFGVAPAEEGGGAGEVGYSTSFDNRSHAADIRTEHKWVVPKTARYNFEVWGADGGMGVRGDQNTNGGVPRYGRGGKVEASILLDAGTEIGIMVGDNGLPAHNHANNQYGNNGTGGWGGYNNGTSMADGGNSIYSTRPYGGTGSGTKDWLGAGGGGGTIVRLFNATDDAGIFIVAGGGGGAGSRGDDNNNSNNQGGAGGNANNKVNETQWGRRGYFAGDTTWGWPGNGTHASAGDASNGGNGGSGYYCGGAGGGGGIGGGGGGATCTYCGGQGGNGGSNGVSGGYGSAGYVNASGGGASSDPGTFLLVAAGGNHNSQNHGGGGGGGYRGGGAGHMGNGSGHAGGGGGGGASSYCMGTGNSYDIKGLNGLTASPRFTSEQKPLRLGNPGGGKVYIWEANKDPLGKGRTPEMTADKIQYLCRSQNGGQSNLERLYFLGSATSNSTDDGGDPDYSCYNSGGYTCHVTHSSAIVMEISGTGLWELHSVTVGAGSNTSWDYSNGRPYPHRCWVHVIEGTETGGVGIHTEKFDNNNPTGFNDPCNGWWAHYKACSKKQNTEDGYIELFFEKPAVMNRGQKYTIALDWSCGGTNSTQNTGGIRYMSSGATSSRALKGSNKGTCSWTGVTAFNGPHGLAQDNGTNTSNGQLVHFGVRSVEIASGGGGGGGGSHDINSTGLIHYWNATAGKTGADYVVDSAGNNTLTSQWGNVTHWTNNGGEIDVPNTDSTGWWSFDTDVTFGSSYSNQEFTFFWCGKRSESPWWMWATGTDGNNFIGYDGGILRLDSNQDVKGDLSYSGMSTGTLYCVYMTMDLNGSMSWYVNGSHVGNNNYGGSWSSNNVIFDSLNHYDSSGSLQTGGKFYFAGFYSRVLSASEISTNWSAHQTRLGI